MTGLFREHFILELLQGRVCENYTSALIMSVVKALCFWPFYYCIRNLTERQRQLVEELAKEERVKDDKEGEDDKEEAAIANAWVLRKRNYRASSVLKVKFFLI